MLDGDSGARATIAAASRERSTDRQSDRAVPGCRSALARWGYPVALAGAIVLFTTAARAGVDSGVAAYVAVLAGAVCVAALERLIPYRSDWRPAIADLGQDAAYLLLVQIALPVLLTVLVAAAIVDTLEPLRGGRSFWPTEWPVALQCLLMMVTADFLRYWLHRACHRIPSLWRLHSVHHCVDKLYWLNVGRFHPLEKTLQYLIDALPFIVLGVGDDVLSLYLVIYAVNGFFQHSNVRLDVGWLNWLVSTADLHRWHHATNAPVACNFGNNLIVWDVVFATRYLPGGRDVEGVGIGAPQTEPSTTTRRGIENTMLRLAMRFVDATATRRLVAATRNPLDAQARVLGEILRANAETRFGRDHAFCRIETTRDYARCVPVRDASAMEPYLEQQIAAGRGVVTRDEVVFCARTSGTTAAARLVPLTDDDLERQRRAQRIAGARQLAARPDAYRGSILAIAGAAVEGHTAGGLPIGSASGRFYGAMPAVARRRFVVPPEVFRIGDFELKYLLIARLAIADADVTHLAAANPSSLSRLCDVIAEHRTELLDDVRRGRFARIDQLDRTTADVVVPRLKRPGAERIRRLDRVLSAAAIRLGDLWPRVRLVTTWTGGSCGVALAALRGQLPRATAIADPGYLSSEFRGTIPIDPERELAIPALLDNYYEFCAREDWEAGRIDCVDLTSLRAGREYYVIVTTRSGLYRYFINDIVRVNGWFNATPALEFVQKGSGATNITGEKLTEGQVIAAVQAELDGAGITASLFLMLCRVRERCYELMLQIDEVRGAFDAAALRQSIDRRLARMNIEYAAKRASGRLLPLRLRRMKRSFATALADDAFRRGQRESQFKPAILNYADELAFDYRPHTVTTADA